MEHINSDMGGEDAVIERDMHQLRYEHLMSYLITSDLDETEVESVARNYAESAQHVRTRWELYKYADNFEDFEKLAVRALHLGAGDTMVDVGTADGKFLYDIAIMGAAHDISLHGVELSEAQLTHSAYWAPVQDDVYMPVQELYGHHDLRVTLRQGTATDLSYYQNDSVAAVSAMFMLYHLDATDRQAALDEFARILRPDGRLVIATSGISNKIVHRDIERTVAQLLSAHGNHVDAPRVMNQDFVSELLEEQFTPFKYVYAFEYLDHITINDAYTFFSYVGSLASMYDQFRPVPDRQLFNQALKIATRDMYEKMYTDQACIETVQRRLFICAQQPQDVPEGFILLDFDDYDL